MRLDLALHLDKELVKRGRRPKSNARDRWARDGWTPHMALGEHRLGGTPYLPEVPAEPAPRTTRKPREARAGAERGLRSVAANAPASTTESQSTASA
jgi:hypothetical protein